MKRLTKVVWAEGMYLGPHQFQAQSRYFESVVQFAVTNLAFAPFGFAGYELDGEALKTGTLSLVHARGVFPDGLAFHIPEHDPAPKPLYIGDLFPAMHDSTVVSLAVPAEREDGMNCAIQAIDRHPGVRYLSEECELADENSGRDARPVALARKNIRFLVDTESDENLVKLPLAQVKRDGAGGYQLDERFVPPCLDINASVRLLAILRRLVEVMEEKCKAIARPKDLASPTASGYSAEGIANAWFLHCVNSALAPLRHLAVAKRPHPEELYLEMSRLAGALCTFGLESHPSRLPLYDHSRLGEVFEALDQHIRGHLELMVPSNRLDIALEKLAAYFWAGPVADERAFHRSRWVFGIYSKVGEAEVIQRTERLVKICSRLAIPKLVERALPGMKLAHLPVPPPAISPKVEYQYFSVDKAGPCWEHLLQTREVGVYIPGELPDPQIELSVILD